MVPQPLAAGPQGRRQKKVVASALAAAEAGRRSPVDAGAYLSAPYRVLERPNQILRLSAVAK